MQFIKKANLRRRGRRNVGSRSSGMKTPARGSYGRAADASRGRGADFL
ncbi:hypothetical protein QFZ42_004337 [Variovorax paradoxus]|nr:hypothetical protein [Variovorax paradoxus]MDQ0572503.1 hypothetical protein [Variovorax paradoxus]